MFMNTLFRGIHTHMTKQVWMYRMIFSGKMVANNKEWTLMTKLFRTKKKDLHAFDAADEVSNILLNSSGKIIRYPICLLGHGASTA